MKYLRLFENDANVVHFNPYVPPPMNIITYYATDKLVETTATGNTAGLHVNAFNSPMISHEFVDGVGTITFEEDVTSIGRGAFYDCYGLTGITIPDSVKSIGWYAFNYCTGLTEVTIGSGVISIEECAFIYCSRLKEITIPDSVTSIRNYAFYECSELTEVTIGSGVTSIGNVAFSSCSGLTEITCKAVTAPAIGNNTFYNVKSGGTLYVSSGASGYDTWMSTGNYYLGKYNWQRSEF